MPVRRSFGESEPPIVAPVKVGSISVSFADRLNIIYRPLDKHFGKMGYSRNFGLAQARGCYVLFLDDDTVILQEDFLR